MGKHIQRLGQTQFVCLSDIPFLKKKSKKDVKRSKINCENTPKCAMDAKKRKSADPQSLEKRPRVQAQRKFAQGVPVFPTGGVSNTNSPLKKSNGGVSGQQSSGSSTASGPTTKKSKIPSGSLIKQKGECPKTEDFLTFLCLRGTNLCPPEFDVFNRATLPPESANQSSDDESIDEDATTKRETPSKQQQKVKQRTSQTSQQREITKNLPESVKALKKKYTEQRIVRTAFSQKLDSKRAENAVKESGMKALRSAKQMVTRNAKDSKSPSGSGNTSTILCS